MALLWGRRICSEAQQFRELDCCNGHLLSPPQLSAVTVALRWYPELSMRAAAEVQPAPPHVPVPSSPPPLSKAAIQPCVPRSMPLPTPTHMSMSPGRSVLGTWHHEAFGSSPPLPVLLFHCLLRPGPRLASAAWPSVWYGTALLATAQGL